MQEMRNPFLPSPNAPLVSDPAKELARFGR